MAEAPTGLRPAVRWGDCLGGQTEDTVGRVSYPRPQIPRGVPSIPQVVVLREAPSDQQPWWTADRLLYVESLPVRSGWSALGGG
ncbi:hypothetical protein EV646_101819 [Kribbella antiqua]|uniref:Uncharacterized protein n=1 Tax=Kribbella antiqua TaxID=2512217 RepID=A0A4R2J1L3_9ACTN|nr:hypothetical protein EV646_101819 [Kribbella antiqua]